MAQLVKNLPAMWETWVRPLGWEDPLEKEMATYSRVLAWRIPRTEEPGRLYSPWGAKSLTRLGDLTGLVSSIVWWTSSSQLKVLIEK